MSYHYNVMTVYQQVCLICFLISVSSFTAASEFHLQFERAWAACEVIDPDEAHGGLWLNPAGYQVYYVRSDCFDKLARRFRDRAACRQVREKWALFSSGDAYTEERCTGRVNDLINKDRQSLDFILSGYRSGPVRLEDFDIRRNGNGRDYDFVPRFSAGGFAWSYRLEFHVIEGGEKYLLSGDGYRLSGGEQIVQFETASRIRESVPRFEAGMNLLVEASLELLPGQGEAGGLWRPELIEEIIPVQERTQRMTRRISF